VIGATPAIATNQTPPPPPPLPTKFYLGSLQDRVVEVKDGLVTISSIAKPFQYFTFTPVRWANFMSYFSQLDDDVKQLNQKSRDVNMIYILEMGII